MYRHITGLLDDLIVDSKKSKDKDDLVACHSGNQEQNPFFLTSTSPCLVNSSKDNTLPNAIIVVKVSNALFPFQATLGEGDLVMKQIAKEERNICLSLK